MSQRAGCRSWGQDTDSLDSCFHFPALPPSSPLVSVQLSVQPVRLAEVVHKALNPKASIVRRCISVVDLRPGPPPGCALRGAAGALALSPQPGWKGARGPAELSGGMCWVMFWEGPVSASEREVREGGPDPRWEVLGRRAGWGPRKSPREVSGAAAKAAAASSGAGVSTVSPSICHEVMGLDAMILVF